jgi:hypothetical protein
MSDWVLSRHYASDSKMDKIIKVETGKLNFHITMNLHTYLRTNQDKPTPWSGLGLETTINRRRKDIQPGDLQ